MYSVYEKLIQGLLDKGFGSVDNWFSIEQITCLRKSLLKRYENDSFHDAGIGNKEQLQTVTTIRSDQIYWFEKAHLNECEQPFFAAIDGFIDYLNRTCFAGIRSYEFHYAVYEKGTFYKKHIDQFKNDDRRQFSVVLYLPESWKKGDGGELILYVKDEKIIIEPLPGRILFFSSDIPHEVTISNIQRLSITGWLKSN